MKKELIERFKEGKIAINLETQQEWNEFMQWLEGNTDLRWQSGHKPTGQDFWWVHQKETGVSSKMGHFDIADYSEVYEIVKYKDLKEKKGMKTSEFIKRVEELGYETDKDNWYVYVRNKRFTVAMVSETRVNAIEANCRYADVPNKLFNLIVEYAKTPLEDREEEKRYNLYNPVKNAYFHYNIGKNAYRWNTYRWVSYIHTDSIQTQFNDEEIKNHKFRDIMELLEKEEVE